MTMPFDVIVRELVAQGVPRGKAEHAAREVLCPPPVASSTIFGIPVVTSTSMPRETVALVGHPIPLAPRDLEHEEQVSLFAWSEEAAFRIPELTMLHAVPNFAKVSKRYGARMKAEGKKGGVPDVCLPLARHGKHGLYLELKVIPNRLTAAQRWWLEALRNEGYAAREIRGAPGEVWTTARDHILAYLNPITEHRNG